MMPCDVISNDVTLVMFSDVMMPSDNMPCDVVLTMMCCGVTLASSVVVIPRG